MKKLKLFLGILFVSFLMGEGFALAQATETTSNEYDDWESQDNFWVEEDQVSSTASSYAPQTSPAYENSTSPPRQPTTTEIFSEHFREANHLYEQKKYNEAQNKLTRIINDGRFNSSQKQKAREVFHAINMELLYSDEPSEGSTIYVVKKGDSLYKIAKKYDTTVELIKRSNGLEKDVIYPDQKLKVLEKPFSVFVDKSENILELKLGGKTFKSFLVATGEDNNTPVGEFKVITKLIDPIWYKTGAVVEAGSPENALGTRWLGFDKVGYGIHGTIEPESIGQQSTAGCVRMLNSEVEELFNLIPRGTKVTVVD